MTDFSRINRNEGHGHAWPRPDGMRMRCGGIPLCPHCARDKALVDRAIEAAKASQTDPRQDQIERLAATLDLAPDRVEKALDRLESIGAIRRVPAPRDSAERIAELLEANNRYQQGARDARWALTDVLNTSGARGDYQALAYADAVERAEALLKHKLFSKVPARRLTRPDLASQCPFPSGGVDTNDQNAAREGWFAYHTGRDREDCPFPKARGDLLNAYRVGWDRAKADAETLVPEGRPRSTSIDCPLPDDAPFAEGWNDYCRGAMRHQCPYVTSVEAERWRSGYDSALAASA